MPKQKSPTMVNRRNLLIGGTAAVLGIGGVLIALSPGKPAALIDDAGLPIEGSLSERAFVDINGVRQGMIIQSADITHPVLLFLHGGPGMPEFFLNFTHPAGLERDFTLVWWDQRGAGLSYGPDIAPASMTLAQLIDDTIAVTQYLRQRFEKDQIYLLGHSWGSYLGIQVAAAAPQLYHAYIGMGQVSCQLRSEVAAYRYMLEAYRARGNTAIVRKLMAAPVSMSDGLSPAYLSLRDSAMHGLGIGTTHDMTSVIAGVFLPVWACRAYTLREKVNIWRGVSFSRRFLWDDFIKTDLTTRIVDIALPLYIFSGHYDFTANHDLARAYFDMIKAPLKGFYTFQNSAHSPLFEEPERARAILMHDVVGVENRLADARLTD
jgi:pimeloyl-ACP methyl ester carboxylesterase